MVQLAIVEEQNKNYDKAKRLYLSAAQKILHGAKDYQKGSKQEKAARARAASYADRAESLTSLLRQQPLTKPPSQIYRVTSTMYQSPPTLNSSSSSSTTTRPPTLLEEPLLTHGGDTEPCNAHNGRNSTGATAGATRPCCTKSFLLSKRGLLISVTLLLLVGVGIFLYVLDKTGGFAPTPPAPQPSANTCGTVPDWQLWKGMVDDSAWYDYIDVNVPVSKLPVTGTMSNGDKVELEIDIDMGGTSKRSSQLYANPQFQQYYDDLIRKWNPDAANRTGTVDGCGFPIGEVADTSTPQLENFKQQNCFYEDFNAGLNLNTLRPLEQKACCERGPPQSTVGCWKWSNGTTYPKGCSTQEVGYKFNGNIGVEDMDVVYPHNTKPQRKNVLRLTSRNEDAGICSDPLVTPACKSKMCHKVIKSSGLVQTSDMYASARFDVVAKVPGTNILFFPVAFLLFCCFLSLSNTHSTQSLCLLFFPSFLHPPSPRSHCSRSWSGLGTVDVSPRTTCSRKTWL